MDKPKAVEINVHSWFRENTLWSFLLLETAKSFQTIKKAIFKASVKKREVKLHKDAKT